MIITTAKVDYLISLVKEKASKDVKCDKKEIHAGYYHGIISCLFALGLITKNEYDKVFEFLKGCFDND